MTTRDALLLLWLASVTFVLPSVLIVAIWLNGALPTL